MQFSPPLKRVIFSLIALFLSNSYLHGHAVGENYVFLEFPEKDEITGHFEFHFKDLEEKLKLSIDQTSQETVLESLNQSAPTVHKYIEKNFRMEVNGTIVKPVYTKQDTWKEKAKFARYHFTISLGEEAKELTFWHQMMYEKDLLHRGMVVLVNNPVTGEYRGEESVALIFNRHEEEQTLDLTKPIDPLLKPFDFVWQGILHIWIGIDHILFLIVLLLPSVLNREDKKWVPIENFKQFLLKILKIVTVFTIAHSITLALAALGFVNLSGRFVESMIAASIIVVALNNFFPKFKEGSTLIIFTFGLFHGLGFASVMGEIPFRMGDLLKILVAFNVGVEIGQVAIVLVVFLLLYLLRKFSFYQPLVLKAGSIAAALVAAYWFIERAFAL